MTEKIKAQIIGTQPFRRLSEEASTLHAGESINVHTVAGSLMAFVAASVFERRGSQVFLIAADKDGAEQLRDDCALLVGESHVRYYGERSRHRGTAVGGLDLTSSIGQIETLKALSVGSDILVVTSPEALVASVPAPEMFTKNLIELRGNTEHAFTTFLDELIRLGFDRKDFIEGYGDFSVRGGIVDVFPYVGDNPIRIEFWGDTVESIREFDILSQRSIRELQSATIVPDVGGKMAGGREQGEDVHKASVFDYLKRNAVVILDGPEMIQQEIEEAMRIETDDLFSWADVTGQIKKFPRIIHSMIQSSDGAIELGSTRQPSFNGSIKTLVREIAQLHQNGTRIYLTCDTKAEADRLKELISEELLQPSDISHRASDIPFTVIPETFHSGFVFPSARIALFTEHEVFGRLRRRGIARRRKFRGFTQRELQQLRRGDYVVHADYGIGQFAGLQRISVRGADQEVMRILYLENDTVYVNLNYIDRVQKYASHEGHVPKLTKLGAPDWERLKSRAKKRIKDIARDLIQLYARRKHERGFAFSPDSHWQKEMEASFIYEDTTDQATATRDVKGDMESESPMDRLICGDVGFGKTEIAVRAAFKAVLDSKQVGVLVPTTILAQQHYNTFKDRLGRYPVRIDFISRFRTKNEQTNLIEALQSGSIDILIGTHRLLSKDIRFKDLGLLVIDEEHRFGVAAKEKLRQLRATVDTLTLTATPIPRTLHFSLMGARDISLINTPPRNRLPIVTEIAQFDWKLIRGAVLKELHRGGQAYFVHDRVQRIEEVRSLLEEHIPEARYAVAHGQMPARPARPSRSGEPRSGWHGHQLEKVMVGFLEKKYDVLVCTKIIESGIDIPNVNTIIINRADRFGLAELYQLRGRVGRSNVQAYAYLVTPPISVLPREAIRRLQAIEEFTELGSGFNLAMRDLEIRGAGNLLGAEQSGFIMEMGYEMYERIVREAVEELKQEEFKELVPSVPTPTSSIKHKAVVEANVDAYIPDVYIESDTERLEVYRRLSAIDDAKMIEDLRAELRDRFGEYPPEVDNIFHLVEIRLLASRLFLAKLIISDDGLQLVLPEESQTWFYQDESGEPSKFQKLIGGISRLAEGKFRLKQDKKTLTFVVDGSMFLNGEESLKEIKVLLGRLSQTV